MTATDPPLSFLAAALVPETANVHVLPRLCTRLVNAGTARVTDARLLRHKRGRRCVIEYRLRLGKTGDEAPVFHSLIGKARARGTDYRTYTLNYALWHGGFTPEGDGIEIPEPLGVVPEFNMWLQKKMPGRTATECLAESGNGRVAMVRAAEALYKLHHAPVRVPRRHTMQDELSILAHGLARVSGQRPVWRSRLAVLLDACRREGVRRVSGSRTTIHRDYYPDQVLLGGEGRIVLLDLDLCAQGDPAIDVGNFIAHLTEWALRHTGDPLALAELEDAFLDRYLELAGSSMRAAIRVCTTLSLARHIYLSTQFAGRVDTTEALLELCERRLSRTPSSESGAGVLVAAAHT